MSTTSNTENAQIARDVITAMCSRDVDRLRELFAPELRFHLPKSSWFLQPPSLADARKTPDPVVDRDGYLASYARAETSIIGAIEPPEFILVAADGNAAMPLVRIRAELRDGVSYDNVYCYPMRIKGGKVVEMCEIHDTMYAFPLYRAALDASEASASRR